MKLIPKNIQKSLMIASLKLIGNRKPYVTSLCGKKLIVDPEVFSPKRFFSFKVSDLLANNLVINNDDLVLEIGTGTGVVALVAADKAKKVVATDINPRAIECAKKNIKLNKVENIEIRQGDLFEPIAKTEKFDLIVWDPPFYFGQPNNRKNIEFAWYCGNDGAIFKKFLQDARYFLKPNGKLQFSFASLEGDDFIKPILNNVCFEVNILKKTWVPGLQWVKVFIAERRASAKKIPN